MNSVPQMLRDSVARWPERPAIIESSRERERSVSFQELEQSANCFAEQLLASGVNRGDHVLTLVPMSIELYVALLGIFRIGAAAMFPDPASTLTQLGHCTRILPTAAMVGIWKAHLLKPFLPGLRGIPRRFYPPQIAPIGAAPGLPHLSSVTPELPALITFTSGSTGKPKTAVRTHEFLVAQYEVLRDAIRLEPGEFDLTTLPIFVLANLAAGVTSLFPEMNLSKPGSADPKKIAPQLRRYPITRTGGSPAFYSRLANSDENLFGGFRKIYTGGAPVFPALLRRLQSLAPSALIEAVYGSTEAEPIAHLSVSEIGEEDWKAMRSGKGLLTGRPIPQIELRIIADQFGEPVSSTAELASGEVGEIVVSGRHVLKGYLGGVGDSETKLMFEGKIWHRTGDAGWLDGEGRLWLLGRCSAKVVDERGVLYPFAVECVAMATEGVRRAAFTNVGQRRILVIETERGIGERVTTSLMEALEWAHLDEVRAVAEIPLDRRHNAKVDYPRLKKLVAD